MKIVFYSTNSNTFNPQTFLYETLPSNQYFFDKFIKKHPDDEFICVSQLPAMFMPEKSVKILSDKLNALEFTDYILTLNVDIAIAMTFWVSPFDWLSINDCLVAQKLEMNGVKTICHSLDTNLICFDKWKTHQFLLQYDKKVQYHFSLQVIEVLELHFYFLYQFQYPCQFHCDQKQLYAYQFYFLLIHDMHCMNHKKDFLS